MKRIIFWICLNLLTVTYCYSQTTEEIIQYGKSMLIELGKSKGIKTKGIKPFSDPTRKAWSHFPKKGRGVNLTLIEDSKVILDQLLKVVLSDNGLEKTKMILNGTSSSEFYFCIYGDPNLNEPWGFSLEGPYLSLNITIVGDNISYTPMLMGANPTKIVIDGKPDDIMRTEEGIPADFMSLLDDSQRKKAVVSNESPGKLLFGLSSKLDFEQGGIAFSELTAKNQTTFLSMTLSVYLHRVHKSLSKSMYDRLYKYNGNELQFLWMGDIADKSQHYYRATTPTLLIEYINLEKEKNNVVSVLREKMFDFGEGYLK